MSSLLQYDHVFFQKKIAFRKDIKNLHCCFNFRCKAMKQKDLFLMMSTHRPHIEKSPVMCEALLF